MIAKQKEWESKNRVEDAVSGALPLHQPPSSEELGGSGMMARLWKRKSGPGESGRV
jgi:hypothetical protein